MSATIVPALDWMLVGRLSTGQVGVGGNVHFVGVCWPKVEFDLTEVDDDTGAMLSSPNGFVSLMSSGVYDDLDNGERMGREETRESG
jgi:hypothetical protein